MPEIILLNEQELRHKVPLDNQAVQIVEDAFAKLATGGVVMPPILSMAIAEQNGEVDVKTAYVPGLDGFAIKVSPGFFDNPKIGLPSLNGMMMLLSVKTGLVQALLLDNGYLTDVRTAAAGAVAAKALAPAQVTTAGVIGTGLQAELQIQALKLVRDFEKLTVWGRDRAKAEAYAMRMEGLLGLPVQVMETVAEVIAASQCVITTTPSSSPLITADMLHEGLHITAMGSDADHKNELAPDVLSKADLFTCDRQSQSAALGELRSAIKAGVIDQGQTIPELGDILVGKHPGRESDQAVTVCDLTGTGVQDTAIATHAFSLCRASGIGTLFQA
ncbi:cyclodeaminase [Aestuariispira insulae]|uniref:Ornithine cyclodeaminase n=1 Tax=Aestuariispira insulae TaxID=1461337 RepID=A0A3D9H2R3_9PROT|nr:cyclodeaminase [Aestuariispira insulae]RED43770.1 ornithine cyclodeaminase [Aestuariispira insulae]